MVWARRIEPPTSIALVVVNQKEAPHLLWGSPAHQNVSQHLHFSFRSIAEAQSIDDADIFAADGYAPEALSGGAWHALTMRTSQ